MFVNIENNYFKILIALLIGFVFFGIGSLFFTTKEATLIGLIALMVTLWTNEGLPLGVVSLLPILLFPSFDILSTNATTANYSNSIIFLFLGGFLVAIAVEKTGLHKIIANKMLTIFPNTPRGIIFSLVITSGVLSSFLSNTTTALLLIPLAIFLTQDNELKTRFALAIAYGASVGGIITPIGTPPNLIFLGIIETKGLEAISFMGWIAKVAPLAFLMFIIVGFVLSIGLKDKKIKNFEAPKSLNIEQKKVLYVVFGLRVPLKTPPLNQSKTTI